ncbi:hypothetical protein D9V78_02105 [Buchnera aphidicola (Sarucallis kahawaluokalani)]|uniref:Uncharacterized protein n=1 Tax=Buchnera aphidicola (Sarucallis kahawaluokalani) TaxID=1241878 RepID=A0A4D6YAM6_9GAMM|nr:hypothetical protein D9V78_02105 [Buchnera aphidicola (Sarucallis kahawaluokalani)]
MKLILKIYFNIYRKVHIDKLIYYIKYINKNKYKKFIILILFPKIHVMILLVFNSSSLYFKHTQKYSVFISNTSTLD